MRAACPAPGPDWVDQWRALHGTGWLMDWAELENTTALVIDGSFMTRQITVSLLNDIGVGMVFQAPKPEDGRRMMEGQVFDFVMCDYDFPHSLMTGQSLLDDLRASKLLPLSTVFFMVTSESSYTKVAEAVESALDNYLLKPYSPSSLTERIYECRRRKLALKPLFDAMDVEEYERALEICEQLVSARARYWLFAARVGAEVAINLGKWQRAQQLYDLVIEANALPWARLGVANVCAASGDINKGQGVLEALVADNPSYVDAYDLLGRMHIERGALEEALGAFRQATSLTPGSLSRLQKHGQLAFLAHEADEAAQMLERAAALGLNSKLFDPQCLVLIAMLRFDKGDSAALKRYRDLLQSLIERNPSNYRLNRFAELIDVMRHLLNKKLSQAVERVNRFAERIDEPEFDFELACDFLGVLDRLVTLEVGLPNYELWTRAVATRFCVSRTATEILLHFGDVIEGEEAINEGFATVTQLAQGAMARAIDGAASEAGRLLVVHAEKTHNARIVELAILLIRKYEVQFEDAAQLLEKLETIRAAYCSLGTRAALGSLAPPPATMIAPRSMPPVSAPG